MIGSRWIVALATLLALMFSIDAAFATLPENYQLGFQEAASDRMEQVDSFHNLLLIITTVITVFVLALLVWVMIRYNSSSNPVPSKTSHNTLIEVVWTVLPVIILVLIAVPSFRLLYYLDELPEGGADLTIKAIGNQWNWTYEYPDQGNFTFTANMVADADLKQGQPRLLTADNALVVPVGKTVRVLVTATDVIHSFALPAFGVKIDAVPGRSNETWFHAKREGVFYGQCSELCGARHAFMPIELHVVSEQEFNRWIAEAHTKVARADGPVSVAAIEDHAAPAR
jgi:cytochrome c oxidase subunit II